MGRAKAFLAYFNKIEKALNTLYGKDDERMSFYELVQALRKKNRQIAYFADDLHEFRALRNAIVHDTIGEVVIAEPCESTVSRIKKIYELITKPKLIQDLCKNQEVITVTLSDTLEEILKLIKSSGYSQFPVLDCKRVIGMLTTNAITNYLADKMIGNELLIDSVTVSDIFKVSDDHNLFHMISRYTTVYDISEMIEEHPKVLMFIMTEQGKTTQQILHVVTSWDFHGIYQERE